MTANLTRRRVTLLPLLSWPSLFSPGLARADGFPLAQLMVKLAAVPQRRATFQEQRRFAALSEPLLSRGHLLYRRPAFLEKVTDWPQPERLVVDGPWLTLTQSNDPPRVIDLRSQPELRAMIDGLRGALAGDLAGLQERFRIDAAGSLAAWTLDLAPRDDRAARFLRSLRLTGRDDAITELRLVQANGDEQWMQIGPSS